MKLPTKVHPLLNIAVWFLLLFVCYFIYSWQNNTVKLLQQQIEFMQKDLQRCEQKNNAESNLTAEYFNERLRAAKKLRESINTVENMVRNNPYLRQDPELNKEIQQAIFMADDIISKISSAAPVSLKKD